MAVVIVFSCVFITFFIHFTNFYQTNLTGLETQTAAARCTTTYVAFDIDLAAYNDTATTRLPYTTPGYLPISCCLHNFDSVLLWCRPLHAVPFRPRTRRSFLSTFIALLLLSGDIESNPGPQLPDYITLGSLNIRSVKSKAALVHDLIQDNNTDILALQETWLPSDSHPAIKLDIAPPGFVVSHVHRPIVAGGPTRGGGLAIIHRDYYKSRPIHLHFQPTSFEMQPLLIYSSTPPILVINIYQPHSPPTSVFYDELSSLLSSVVVESTARLVLCGDVNCPGDDDRSVNSSLDDVLVSCGLQQHVHQSTRGNNLLDIVATSDPGVVQDIKVKSKQ